MLFPLLVSRDICFEWLDRKICNKDIHFEWLNRKEIQIKFEIKVLQQNIEHQLD